ncbi:YheC/YheD family protein [Paenibacillus sp. GP183]|uniref:YheC/YheD family endospore coat-associated protein n=1 Tax=Paenibacillus sp. GP183 TaxID=1882751 RepID=UPI00089D9232|nr:YheC/YheD family protein [Paenibacillus sp. GP183]SEB89695.1 YheC/D like ATP-grasp [Paenibacillus sp. GP183]
MRRGAKRMPLLGIMVAELPGKVPFANAASLRALCLLGISAGIEVFVFSPNRIDWSREQVTGYTYQAGKEAWMKINYALPNLIYDRCFFASKASYQDYSRHLRQLRGRSSIRFLGYGLPGKWEVMQILQRDPYFHPFLPETRLLTQLQEVLNWLELRSEVFLKPKGGSQGRGVLYIKKHQELLDHFILSGRDRRNHLLQMEFQNAQDLKFWLRTFIGQRIYLLQEYLSLHTANGNAYDIRSLVQKNRHGYWELTGMGVRCGQSGSITANLHGGGTAWEAAPFLKSEFSQEQVEEQMNTLIELSTKIPLALESAHGRLAELGIDLGIDRNGRVWLLEVNSKPGRSLFTKLPNKAVQKSSKENPILYAAFLLYAQKTNRMIAEASSFRASAEIKQGQQV